MFVTTLIKAILFTLITLMAACGGSIGGDTTPLVTTPLVTPPPPDADSDGVVDSQDICANTPANTTVDGNGCAPEQLDNDSDGVYNELDKCQATPVNETVDAEGCGIDTQNGALANDFDADNVLNDDDLCQFTPRDEFVDASGCSESQKDADGDVVNNDVDSCDATPMGETVDARGCGTISEADLVASAFVEADGMVVVEMESTNYSGNWQLETGAKSSGNAYLVYTGSNNFNTPNIDTITVPVVVNSPGIYRFVWLNIIGEGNSPTEANDSWLKIESSRFYGKKISDAQGETPLGHIVCPNGQPTSNNCAGASPEGSSSQGWFKVYRTGSPTDAWVWRSFTSDGDPHAIYAEFAKVGQYNILIAGRSFGHGIDRFVLFRDDNASNNVAESEATDIAVAESARE